MDFYQEQPKTYHEMTHHIDPSPFLSPLTKYIDPPAKILDVGCASGRDLLWFKSRGYRVFGLDRSFGLIKLAKKNLECPVFQADFHSFDFSKIRVQGILLIGALVHEEKQSFPKVLNNILQALDKGSYILLSLKKGQGRSHKKDGREFILWEKQELDPIFNRLNLEILERKTSNSGLGTGEKWLSYLLQDKFRPA